MALLEVTPAGLFCPAGGFHVDPREPVDRAVLTHAHGDHARPGSRAYLAAAPGLAVLHARLGRDAPVETRPYGAAVDVGGVRVSFHPAGHVLGSAQVRLEHRGEVWVVSGDYKLAPDPTCTPLEPVRCHTFLTESTFGLPIYRWDPEPALIAAIEGWWRANQERGEASVLFAYALGKAQRVLARVDKGLGPIFTHGAVEEMNRAYRAAGVALPATTHVSSAPAGAPLRRGLVVAPPAAAGTGWMRRFAPYSNALASGWMRVRGPRRRRALDRGFALSDHADWPALLAVIAATGASRVLVTHGHAAPLARWLREQGTDAGVIEAPFADPASGDDAPAAGRGDDA